MSDDTTTPTDEQLAAWERVAGEATMGPWDADHFVVHSATTSLRMALCENEANARFIAEARDAVPHLLALVRQLRAAAAGAKHPDSVRLDWWEQHYNDGPFLGFFTDGVLGLGRGHIVDSRWTVRGKGYPSLRDAIDAAIASTTEAQHV